MPNTWKPFSLLTYLPLLLIPSTAAADWPDFDTIQSPTGDYVPSEAAIRQQPDDDDIYVIYSHLNSDTFEVNVTTNVWMRAAQCSNGDGCATGTLGDLEQIGTTLYGAHLAHPSLAIRKIGGTIEMTAVRVQKIESDCDDDTQLASGLDEDDQDNSDLMAHEIETDGDGDDLTIVDDWVVSKNAASSDCSDRGVSSTVYHNGNAWTCFTYIPEGGTDYIACNDNHSVSGGAWDNLEELDEPSFGTEDHPSLQFRNSERMVAASNRNPADHDDDHLRLHFPDTSGYPIISVPGRWSNYPSIATSGGMDHLVWSRDVGGSADLFYSSCEDPGCDSGPNWSGWTGLSSGHSEMHPHVAVDNNLDFVMVAYMADHASLAGTNMRVWVRWKCGNGGWQGPEIVRTNNDQFEHQSIAHGRPPLVLNRDEQIAHIVLADDLDGAGPEESTTGSLYWYRKEYSCP